MVADGGAGNFKALNRMEKALTAGGSLTQIFTLVKEEDATLSFDYFRTQFYNSVIADQEYSPNDIYIYRARTNAPLPILIRSIFRGLRWSGSIFSLRTAIRTAV